MIVNLSGEFHHQRIRECGDTSGTTASFLFYMASPGNLKERKFKFLCFEVGIFSLRTNFKKVKI
jgi:hypothetical protein